MIGRDARSKFGGDRADAFDRCRIRIDPVDVEALAKQVDEVAAAAAAAVDDAIATADPAAQQLIEQVDVDCAELILERQGSNR